MGTRASFFVGDPSDTASRFWLGCVAFDGYPSGDCGQELVKARTQEEFIGAVSNINAVRDDFTDAAQNSFPFPWKDDLYLTDYTYAFFDGRVQVTCFHGGWRDLTGDLVAGKSNPWPDDVEDELPGDIPAPSGEGPPGPDSIMIITSR